MGHNTLSVIPRSKRWTDVVALIGDGATSGAVVAASARAAEKDMLRAAQDPVFVEAVRLLLAIPAAARSEDFGDALRTIDLPVGAPPELLDLVIGVTERLDQVRAGSTNRTDLGELAGRALTSTLSTIVGDALPGLFEATPGDVQVILRKLSWSRGISELSRQFFGAIVRQSLSYWLDRTLATHVGADRRFPDTTARDAFDQALDQYVVESTRIIKEFSGGWYGKTLHREGQIRSEDATIFGAVAMKKIVAELRARNWPDA